MTPTPNPTAEQIVADAIRQAENEHRLPKGAYHVAGGFYRHTCSCRQWSADIESDESVAARTGRTTVRGQGEWDRAAREHDSHLYQQKALAALRAAGVRGGEE